MANARDAQLRALRAAEKALYALDDRIAARLAQMYDAARRELLAELADWYARNGSPSTPTELRVLAGQVYRIRAIDKIIKRLGDDVAGYLEDHLPGALRSGFEAAYEDVQYLARELRVNVRREALFAGLDDQLAVMVDGVIGQVPNLVEPLAGTLRFELQYGLTQGDSFVQIVQRLLAADIGAQGASFFRRGATSMALFSRRAVIDANNASRQLVYERAQRSLPRMQKQVIAAIDGRTTECCLRAHGQIQPLDRPYKLTGQPRFAAEMMFPAFHWNCRSSSVAYLADFEEGSQATTARLRAEARAELDTRGGDAGGG